MVHPYEVREVVGPQSQGVRNDRNQAKHHEKLVLLASGGLAACGSSGGDIGGAPDPNALSAARSNPSGDAQTGTAGQDLANPLRIVVLKGSTPLAGAVVTWTTSGDGTLTPATTTTGADGLSISQGTSAPRPELRALRRR